MRIQLHAKLPASPSKGMDRVIITSRFCPGMVYVARMVKSTGVFGKRRYLINASRIMRTLPASENPIMD